MLKKDLYLAMCIINNPNLNFFLMHIHGLRFFLPMKLIKLENCNGSKKNFSFTGHDFLNPLMRSILCEELTLINVQSKLLILNTV